MTLAKTKKPYLYLIGIVLLVGISLRVFGLEAYPNSLNADEASAAYDAFSIMQTGMDRNGNFLPVFLEAWGSGQNALYSYLLIPFIAIFGLSMISIRLPMALLGCISLVVFYCLLKRMTNQKIAIVGLIFLAICPWHIMKSRWGLESNLFPDFMLLSIFLLVKGLQERKKIWQIGGYILAGLTAYSYGTSYFFLPLFFIPLLIILVKRKEISRWQAIFSLSLIGLVSLPMIIFVIINTFDLPEISLPFMTIPKLEVNRYQEITSIFSSDFLQNSIANFWESIKVLIFQTDYLPWNAIWPYGTIYLFSTFFTIIGVIKAIRKRNEIQYGYIMGLWLLVAFFLLLVCEPNINRMNIIFFPLIFYTAIGIEEVIGKGKVLLILVSVLYAVSLGGFCYSYSKQDANDYRTFEGNLQEPITYLSTLTDYEIYVTNQIKEPYIYVLYYTKYPVKDYIKTVQYYNEGEAFEQVKSFGNYHFEEIKELKKRQNVAYMVTKEEYEKIKEKPQEYGIKTIQDWKKIEFENYVVLLD